MTAGILVPNFPNFLLAGWKQPWLFTAGAVGSEILQLLCQNCQAGLKSRDSNFRRKPLCLRDTKWFWVGNRRESWSMAGRGGRQIGKQKKPKKTSRASHHCNPGVSPDPGGLFPQKAPSKPAQFLPQDDLSTNSCLHPLKFQFQIQIQFHLPPLTLNSSSSLPAHRGFYRGTLLFLEIFHFLSWHMENTHRNPKRKLTNYSWETMRLQAP